MMQIEIATSQLYELWHNCPYDLKTFDEFVKLYIDDPDWIVVDDLSEELKELELNE